MRRQVSIASAPRDRVPGLIPKLAGVGLRFPHHQAVIERRPRVAWFEVHTENYMGGGAPLRYLEAIRRDYPLSLHGVGLSLGRVDGLDADHLDRIVRLAARIEPGLVSEPLTWSISDRNSTIAESEFMVAVARRTGCGILCDVNNIFVSAANHGWDAVAYLEALPPTEVKELHLAGHTVKQLSDGAELRIDDHASPVEPAVWALFRQAVLRFGARPTMIEWDSNIPPLEVLVEQADQASAILSQPHESRADADA